MLSRHSGLTGYEYTVCKAIQQPYLVQKLFQSQFKGVFFAYKEFYGLFDFHLNKNTDNEYPSNKYVLGSVMNH